MSITLSGLFWVTSLVCWAGAITAIVFPIMHFQGSYEFSATTSCSCNNNQDTCSDSDKTCTEVSPETNAYLCLILGGIVPLFFWCVFAFLVACCWDTDELEPFRCCAEVFKKIFCRLCCWCRGIQCPHFEYQMVTDTEALARARERHSKRVAELETQAEDRQRDTERIKFEVCPEDGPGIQVESYPDITVQVLASQLQLPPGTEIALASAALPEEATLDSQGVVQDTQLTVPELKGAREVSSDAETIVIPSNEQLRLEATKAAPPQPSDHQMEERTLRCISWSSEYLDDY